MATELIERSSDRAATRPTRVDVVASVVVISNIGIAYPLLDLLGRHSEFLVAHDAGAVDLVVLAAALTVGVPAALGATALSFARLPAAATAVHYGLLTVLSAVMAVQVAIRVPALDSNAALAFLVSAVAGVSITVSYHVSPALRTLLRYGIVTPVLVAAMFLFVSPASEMLQGGTGGGAPYSVDNPVPVVMVVLDELPASSLVEPDGDIDADLYPNFARLAGTSTWYRDATAVHHATAVAVPSILTGDHPSEGGLPIAANYPDNLFTLLSGDYELHVIEPVTSLCPVTACAPSEEEPGLLARMSAIAADLRIVALHMVLPETLSSRLPAVDETWAGFGDRPEQAPESDEDDEEEDFRFRDRVEEARATGGAEMFTRLAEAVEPATGPTLHFLHVMLPHSPWQHLPSGATYGPGRTLGRVDPPDTRWSDNDHVVRHSYQRHLWQLMYTDRLLGTLLDRLEEVDRYDDSLVVVTADHGITFRPGKRLRRPDDQALSDVAAVPLFIKYPAQQSGRVVDDPVQVIDVVPTIAGVLGIDPPPEMDGRPLYPDVTPTATRTFTVREDGPVRFGRLGDRILQGAERRRRLFGTGVPDMARGLPHAAVIGEEVASLPVEEPEGRWRAFIAGMDAYRGVRLAGELPAVIRGRLHAPDRLDEDTLVAIAMNGRVVTLAALGEFEEERSAAFYALADEDAFTEGDNDLRIYAIEPGGPLRLLSVDIRN